VPEYELFRYIEEDDLRGRFKGALNMLESIISSDRTKYRKWKESKLRLFSQETSQVYSDLFEILVLGDLVSSKRLVEPYHENIDGRVQIEDRFVYFEVKSLQKTNYDLEGVGVGGVQHDEHQILTALSEKASQPAPYRDSPAIIIMSLYRLADQTTGNWYTKDYFKTDAARGISGVVLYNWFTGGSGKQVLVNGNAAYPLSEAEKSFFSDGL